SGSANGPHRSASCLLGSRWIDARQYVGQVQQRTPLQEAVTRLRGELCAFLQVSDRFGALLGNAQVNAAGEKQATELTRPDVDGLAESERFGAEPVRVGQAPGVRFDNR